MPEPNDKDAGNTDSLLNFYGRNDDGRSLPFVQLGDVFVKDNQSNVFAVINASCDLQMVPADVSKTRKKKGRTRSRDDSVLLLPGETCELGMTSPIALTTELFAISEKYYAIVWKPKQLVSVPHCCLRMLLEDRGYLHEVRLQMDRAIELQQEAFASNSRVGLEVQPQLSRTVGLRISVRVSGSFKPLGDDILLAGGIFHTRSQTVLVVNHDCLGEMKKRLTSMTHNDLAEAVEQFKACYADLHRCPFVAKRDAQPAFKLLKPNNATHSCDKIRVGFSSNPLTPTKCAAKIYFHFFEYMETNAD